MPMTTAPKHASALAPEQHAPSVPPPYDTPSAEITQQAQAADLSPDADADDPFLRPHPCNHFLIKRTFGPLRGARYVIDPNISIPDSLLRPERTLLFLYEPKPRPNLELDVTFGAVELQAEVQPFRDADPPPATAGPSTSRSLVHPRGKAVQIKVSTGTGDISLRVPTGAGARTPLAVHATSTLGAVRVYLPRTLHGPLTFASGLRRPRLSPALRRASTPLRDGGSGSGSVRDAEAAYGGGDASALWFVGDMAAWRAQGERGDAVHLGSTLGDVWVGYADEEPERRASKVHIVGAVVMVLVLLWALGRVVFAWGF